VDLSIADLQARVGAMPLVSPDGSRIAYVGGNRLHVRSLDRFDAKDVADGRDISFLTWSPDGRQLAFVRRGRAWRVPAAGEDPVELGAVPEDLAGSGGSTWTADGRIVFGGSDTVGLFEIPAAGGPGRELLPLDRKVEQDFHEVVALPDGRGFVFVVHRRETGADTLDVFAGGVRRVLAHLPGERIRELAFSPTGHILYSRTTTDPGVRALPFSLDRLEATGPPLATIPGAWAPSVARDGTLLVVRSEESPVELVRVARGGAVAGLAALPGEFSPMLTPQYYGPGYRTGSAMSLSPDGTRLALAIGFTAGLYVHDLERGSLSRLAPDIFPLPPVWTPRGDRILYASGRGARAWNLSSRRADAAGEEERVSRSDEVQMPLALSPDGRWLVYVEGSGAKGALLKMPLDGSGPSAPLFAAKVRGHGASFSPDGRFIAYESDESERMQVYVRPFREGDGLIQVSTNGGEAPVWSRSGGEIFFHSGEGVEAAAVSARGGSLVVSKPTLLFRTGGETGLVPTLFDAAPDGRSFFLLRSRMGDRISLVFNWPGDLERLAEGQEPRTSP
jgi:hypothetical protein